MAVVKLGLYEMALMKTTCHSITRSRPSVRTILKVGQKKPQSPMKGVNAPKVDAAVAPAVAAVAAVNAMSVHVVIALRERIVLLAKIVHRVKVEAQGKSGLGAIMHRLNSSPHRRA